ncbi:hypothetical protein OH76DRAFT_1490873 [Lentinus brumalis]|uniref:Uncharacterized protein n=1 Tax=Lentinus brumalis TaxID=2498619 RepID=A0A371CHG1_9APHY|nr:hypothetical protein OH76DRAFT_1490873 [Polyporus brumalis]
MSTNPITQSVPKKKKVKSPKDDPTEGDGRRWVTGSKFEFLTARLPLWHDARELSEMSTFYSRITLLFIRFFTWDRALDSDGNGPAEDPSEDNLDAILDVTGLQPNEIARRNTVYIELRSKLQRWFRYHGTKALKSKRVDPLSKILSAFKSQEKPPRRMQTLQFYSKLYYDTRIKATVDAEWPKVLAQAGAKGAPPPKRLRHQNIIVAQKFAAETPGFQAALKKQRDAEFDEEYAAWKASSLDSADIPKSAEEFAGALEEAATWLHPLAESLSKRLGLNVSILLTGPMGSSGGRIDVKAVHAGKSSGLTPKLWPDYDGNAYQALLKSLIGFAKTCFTLQECHARALPGTVPPDQDILLTSSPSSSVASLPPAPTHQDAVVRTVPLCIPADALVASSTRGHAASAAVSVVPPPPPAIRGGSRSLSTPAIPSPLRMVSHPSSLAETASVPSNSATPASAVVAEAIYGPPSMFTDIARVNVSQSPPLIEVGGTASDSGRSSSTPTERSPSAPSSSATMASDIAPPPALSATPAASATRKKRSQPPPSSSPTADSTTPPTETSPLPSSSPSPNVASAKKPAAGDLAAASPRRMRASPAPASISAGPRTLRAPAAPTSISAGPTFGRTTTRSSGRAGSLSAGAVSVGPAPISKINDKNCPSAIADTIQYLRGHEWGPVWDHCIATWVEIERFAQFKAHGTLQNPTVGRPLEVAAWMKRARKLVDYPIKDVVTFADGWLKWWTSNKPVSDGTIDVPANLNWAVLNVSGSNGVLLFMLLLAWWGAALEDDQENRGKWLLAVSDVRVALDRVLLAAARGYNRVDVDIDVDIDTAEGDEASQESVSSRKRQRVLDTPGKSVVKKRKVGKK